MKILLLNQNWFATELRDMGHTVLTCGTAPHLEHQIPSPVSHIDHILSSLPNGFYPDRIVWLDNSCPVMIMGLEDCDIPILFYSVDTQHHYTLHSHMAPCFDHVLVAQKDYLSRFSIGDTPTQWMPLWAPEYVEASAEKKFGATFVGTLNPNLNPDRVRFFEALGKLVPIHVTQGHYPTIFPHAEIVVNQTVKGDLNFRVFETMMCGALLLTEKTENGLLEIFADNTHLVTYTSRDPHDAAEKVRSLLADLPRARSIAEAGRAEVLARHTMRHRALTLEEILRSLTKRARSPLRHFGYLMNTSLISELCERANPAVSTEVAALSLDYAARALREGAIPDSLMTGQIIRACIRHDRLIGGPRGAAVIDAYAHALPSHFLFSLLKVRHLLNQGKRSEAHELAASISSHPVEETFSTAEHAVSLIMQ